MYFKLFIKILTVDFFCCQCIVDALILKYKTQKLINSAKNYGCGRNRTNFHVFSFHHFFALY